MRIRKHFPMCAALRLLSACGARNQSESQMTSFTAGETKADTANLFTLPADHCSPATAPATRGTLPESYDSPDQSPITPRPPPPSSRRRRPRARNPGHARRHAGPRRATAAHHQQPGLLAGTLHLPQSQRRLSASRKKLQARPRPIRTQSHRRTRRSASRIRPRPSPSRRRIHHRRPTR